MRLIPRRIPFPSTAARAALVLGLAFSTACTTYDSRYRFRPRPLEVEVLAEQDRALLVHGWVTVVGIRTDEEEGLPPGAEMRLAFENPGGEQVEVDLAAARLYSADLEVFGPPTVLDAESVLTVAAGADASATLLFPFAEGQDAGDTDLEGLNLRWRVRRGTEVGLASATFEREETRYRPIMWDDPWYRSRYYTCFHPACIGHYGIGGLSCY